MIAIRATTMSQRAIFSSRLCRERSWNGVTVLTVWWNALTERGYLQGRTGVVAQRPSRAVARDGLHRVRLPRGDEVGFALAPANR